MAEPWLSLIGVGEDGPAGLTDASRDALNAAEFVFGGPRHLELLSCQGLPWPVPFSVDPVLALRGRRVAVLASGDPFWFGVGGSLTPHLHPDEWRCFPAPATFSLAAARMGWRLEDVLCLGLHAAPLNRLRPHLANGQRILCLLRDGAAVTELAQYLVQTGFGASDVQVLQALGGPREGRFGFMAQDYAGPQATAPICAAITAVGQGLSRASGLPDEVFDHDGQITKRPARALTLSALAPRAGDVLWDIGTGSGSIAVEFLLAAPNTQAYALEADAARATRAAANAERFGLSHRFHLTVARAPDGLDTLPDPDAVFVGGGATGALLTHLWQRLPKGTRLVANAVTLETEVLLAQLHGANGGSLLRIELAEAAPLGTRTGWQPQRPLVQWSVTR